MKSVIRDWFILVILSVSCTSNSIGTDLPSADNDLLGTNRTPHTPTASIATPTGSSPTDEVQQVFDLLVNYSDVIDPVLTCMDRSLPGQVMVAVAPYEALTNVPVPTNSGAHSTTWSPNRDHFAYIVLDREAPIETTIHDDSGVEMTVQYKNAESVWGTRSDSNTPTKLSGNYPREEQHNVDGSCYVTAGIRSIVGMSNDGKYLAFEYSDWSNNLTELIIIEYSTGDLVAVENSVPLSQSWAPLTNRIALVDNNKQHISILEVAQSNDEGKTFLYPIEWSNSIKIVQTQWMEDESGLLVVRTEDGKSDEEVWQLDFQTNQWNQTSIVSNFINFMAPSRDGKIWLCIGGKGFQLWDINRGVMDYEIIAPDGVDCGLTSYYSGGDHSEIAYFIDISSTRNIWEVDLLNPDSSSNLLVSLSSINLPKSALLVGRP